MNLNQQLEYYLAHQNELVEQYNGLCLVIKGLRVIGVYKNEIEAVVETEKEHEPGSFLVQRVSPGDEAYTATFHSRVVFS